MHVPKPQTITCGDLAKAAASAAIPQSNDIRSPEGRFRCPLSIAPPLDVCIGGRAVSIGHHVLPSCKWANDQVTDRLGADGCARDIGG
jgi:hypothetical protein